MFLSATHHTLIMPFVLENGFQRYNWLKGISVCRQKWTLLSFWISLLLRHYWLMNSEKQRGWGWQKAFVAKAERLLRLKLETYDIPILIQCSVCGKETERWPSGGTAVGLLAKWILPCSLCQQMLESLWERISMVGMKWVNLLNQSSTTMIVWNPFERE